MGSVHILNSAAQPVNAFSLQMCYYFRGTKERKKLPREKKLNKRRFPYFLCRFRVGLACQCIGKIWSVCCYPLIYVIKSMVFFFLSTVQC